MNGITSLIQTVFASLFSASAACRQIHFPEQATAPQNHAAAAGTHDRESGPRLEPCPASRE
jgi:hypothetical protein